MLAVAVVGTVVGILKYRKISKATDSVSSFASEGKEVINKVGKDVNQMKQTTDNINLLVNDGRKVAGEIGEEFSKIKQTLADAISNLDDITENKKEMTK